MSLSEEERSSLVSLYWEKADYDCVFNATEDDIMIYIPAAKEMFNSVKQLVL